MNVNQRIALLILKEKYEIITDDEKSELSELLNKKDKLRLYKEITDKDFSKSIQFYDTINEQKALLRYKKRYPSNRHRIQKFYLKLCTSVAAVVLLSFACYELLNNMTSQIQEPNLIRAGSSQAMLILSNGETIELDNKDDAEKIIINGTVVDKSNNTLNYHESEVAEIIINELTTPRGGEYKVKLSDGTMVWLNSMSKLKYPVSFGTEKREVFLEGEAYFEVVKDEKRPFIVIVNNDVNINVLGTSFNVRAYTDESLVETTLETGSVVMNHKCDTIKLEPKHIGILNKITNDLSSAVVDTESYTAWKNGQFIFNKESIEQILNKLSRWYNFNVIFEQDDLKQILFSGSIKKYDNINLFLEAVEVTGKVRFDIKGDIITVKPR